MHYRITSSAGADLGTYEGDSARDALDAVAREAGAANHDASCDALGIRRDDWTTDRFAFKRGAVSLLVVEADAPGASPTDRAARPVIFGTSIEIPARDVALGDYIACRNIAGGLAWWAHVREIDARRGFLFMCDEIPYWGATPVGTTYVEQFRGETLIEVRAPGAMAGAIS